MKTFKAQIIVRYALVAACILIFSGAIIGEVVDTTITHKEEWDNKADSILKQRKVLYPKRGDILACDGSVLATNVTTYTVRIDYQSEQFKEKEYRDSMDKYVDSLLAHFDRFKTKDEWKDYLLAPLDKEKKKRPRSYTLLKNITYTEYLKLRTFPFFNFPNKNKCGIVLESRERRKNPYGEMASRSIGVVGEIKATKERHGVWGLESDLDSLLYGKTGLAKVVPVNINTINWTEVPPVDGYDITTTIDINLQDIVENELNEELVKTRADWGVAILMEVETGDIKAIANLEMDTADHRRYIEGSNRAVVGVEPGSVMKPISMLVALEKGWVTPNTVIQTGQKYKYASGPAICDCSPVSSMPVWEVIERSSNIGMTKVVMPHLEYPQQFKECLTEIGFFEPMNLHIAGERVPRIRNLGNSNWDYIDASRMTYGYATEIPPIYTLSIYNAIANGGKYVRPRFVTKISGAGVDSVIPVSYVRDRICSEENAEILTKMLKRVVWGDHGTARLVLKDKRVEIAGKTGTCYAVFEKPRVNKKTGKVITKDMYGRDIPNGTPGTYDENRKRLSFCGFFPAENPKYSCFVMMFHPKNGVGAAASSGVVLKDIALKMYSRGLLGNESDFKAQRGKSSRPTMYAANAAKYERVKDGLNLKSINHYTLKTQSSGVPSVVGMGLRDAISTLENAGYNVDFDGVGCVVSQLPAAGTMATKGDKIKLRLSYI